MDADGRALVVAANIAGAATLAATADRAAQRQALRDGIADFPVTMLDEALRILKNQLRKREPVAVCVGLEPSAVALEMSERGVEPDIVRDDVPVAPRNEWRLRAPGARGQEAVGAERSLVVWQVAADAPKDLAKLDEAALACLNADEWAARRWLHLAPRYMGRMTHGLRLLAAHGDFAARFAEELKLRAVRGEIEFAYEIRSYV